MVKLVQEKAVPRNIWHKIASRKPIGDGIWRLFETAVMTLDEAKVQYDAGLVEMCQARIGEYFVQFVLVREKPVPSRGFFFPDPIYNHFHRARMPA